MRAVITGVAGQDGSYLAELLLEKGYDVYGVARRNSVNQELPNLKNVITHQNFTLLKGDIKDPGFISSLVHEKPDEWYNLAAQSNVGQSFIEPTATFDVNATSVVTQLDLIRSVSKDTRYYQASTSELFGGLSCPKSGYTENSTFHPRSPYGVSKLAAYWSVINAREAYGIYACNGILHNHSSPRRGLDFATRKITHGIASYKLAGRGKVKMGNLNAFRDEGHAKDYVKAMYLMLQQESPDDFLIATGSGATIRDMFSHVCDIAGFCLDEVYEQDERYMRPSEVNYLLGDPSKAKEKLGWSPEYTWKELLREMYFSDFNGLKNSF